MRYHDWEMEPRGGRTAWLCQKLLLPHSFSPPTTFDIEPVQARSVSRKISPYIDHFKGWANALVVYACHVSTFWQPWYLSSIVDQIFILHLWLPWPGPIYPNRTASRTRLKLSSRAHGLLEVETWWGCRRLHPMCWIKPSFIFALLNIVTLYGSHVLIGLQRKDPSS